jgi:hypothetical protein
VIRRTRELLASLASLNQQVPGVVLGILDASLPPAEQAEFGDLLIAAGERLREHARTERAEVIDSDTSENQQRGNGIESRHSC